ncbi:hypothetical protein BJV78DRAFT_1226000 [Lactifluus subvellereus]|nr:hypothetical protein BJV78DRAFT_1226000 [Lactifluus subvellereus]
MIQILGSFALISTHLTCVPFLFLFPCPGPSVSSLLELKRWLMGFSPFCIIFPFLYSYLVFSSLHAHTL